MRKIAGTALALIALAPIGLFLLAWSGLYNVAASRGHFAITAWLLEFGMRNSVDFHANGIRIPDLADPALRERGVLYFQTGCAPCHGAPGIGQSAVARHMLPAPPDLSKVTAQFEPGEVFWIVRHGLKYTGMPAWPADGRDDEVWAMVALLAQLPGMTAESYRRLANLEHVNVPGSISLGDRAQPLTIECGRCHGDAGEGSPAGGVPRIAGQRLAYLMMTLADYEVRLRASGMMHPVASALTEADRRALAEHYASIDVPRPATSAPDGDRTALIELGAKLASSGLPERSVGACESCHGPEGSAADKHPRYPALAGQHERYLEQQLKLWREGLRGGRLGHIMTPMAKNLSDREIDALAAYYANRPGGSVAGSRPPS